MYWCINHGLSLFLFLFFPPGKLYIFHSQYVDNGTGVEPLWDQVIGHFLEVILVILPYVV